MILLKNAKFNFVLSSLFVAILGLVKSLIFAKYLSFESLGFLALFQSTMALVATFHFGILSGGYRLASFYSEEKFKELNSIIFSLLFYLLVIFVVILVFLEISDLIDEINYLGFFAGCIVLFSNWVMNISIAKGNLSKVNKAQLCGAFASVITLPFVFEYGLFAAYAVVIIQPIVIIFFLTKNVSGTLPDSLNFDISIIEKIFKAGFFPFLAGLFFITYQQLEKIFIGKTIGVETLGHLTLFYLVFTVWSIVPDSLNKIFYPKSTFLFEMKRYYELNLFLVKHFGIIIVYCFICSFTLYFTLIPIVEVVLPQHMSFVSYIYLGLGVYIFKSLCETPSIYLLSSGSNNAIVVSDALCFLIYLLLFGFFFYSNNISVEVFIFISTFYYFFKFIVLVLLSLWRNRECSKGEI